MVFSTRHCGYCVRAKRLLERKNIPFIEIDLNRSSETRQWLVNKTGMWTVPQIFVDGEVIGGYRELEAMAQQGRFDDFVLSSITGH
ncbi:MAG: glutaredoxin [Acidobacteria bacterium]|nr:glutaredoxin [Acidobacteriota bacterium]